MAVRGHQYSALLCPRIVLLFVFFHFSLTMLTVLGLGVGVWFWFWFNRCSACERIETGHTCAD